MKADVRGKMYGSRRIEEHDMLNWVKANRKAMNAGKMKSERIDAFEKILALMEECKRVNQYV